VGHLSALADSVIGALGGCDDAPLASALLLGLVRAEPIADGELAADSGRDEAHVSATLAEWPTVQRDEQGRVIAFSGLTLSRTTHRFEVDGHELYTWCAWDTLFLPALLDRPARVQSRCPVTGVEVRLTVTPDGVTAADPEPLAVSLPRPDTTTSEDIAGSFCCHVHFLAGPEAGKRWLVEHQGANVLTLDEAFELGRHATRACLGRENRVAADGLQTPRPAR
jgi:alkylmercury lyase